jgi:thymidylate synthase
MNYILQPYDDALAYVLENGEVRENRTGVNTLSVFGYQMRFNISERFPILTKRKMFPKAIFAELLWILSGSTNVRDLEALGCKVWTPWVDKDFEDRNNYFDGELGPIYGFNLRHFGAPYNDRYESVSEEYGFDQLDYVVNELKNNKTSRRIMFSYWDPSVVTTDEVRLPPCHLLFQLNVDGKDRLSGILYQRSADLPVGSPFNIASYSALIYMLAAECGYIPFEFIYTIADSHIYENQIDAVNKYLLRTEVDSPILKLNKVKDISSYTLDDFELIDYNPMSGIIMPVAV